MKVEEYTNTPQNAPEIDLCYPNPKNLNNERKKIQEEYQFDSGCKTFIYAGVSALFFGMSKAYQHIDHSSSDLNLNLLLIPVMYLGGIFSAYYSSCMFKGAYDQRKSEQEKNLEK